MLYLPSNWCNQNQNNLKYNITPKLGKKEKAWQYYMVTDKPEKKILSSW